MDEQIRQLHWWRRHLRGLKSTLDVAVAQVPFLRGGDRIRFLRTTKDGSRRNLARKDLESFIFHNNRVSGHPFRVRLAVGTLDGVGPDEQLPFEIVPVSAAELSDPEALAAGAVYYVREGF